MIAVAMLSAQTARAKLECPFPQSCGFGHTMPLYDQNDPALADMEVPCATFSNEQGPAYDFPKDACGAFAGAPNPWVHSWLPLGPPSVWAQSCYWMSADCGPAAGAMSLMAAINNMSRTNSVLANSWVQSSFVRPSGPEPVRESRPDPAIPSMSLTDVQRVVNMAVQQGTLPNAGGGGGAFADLASRFKAAQGHHWWQGASGSVASAEDTTFVKLIMEGRAVVLGLGCQLKTVKRGPDAQTQVFDFSQPCAESSGHIVALNGYSSFEASGNKRALYLTLHDPFNALRVVRSYHVLRAGKVATSSLPRAIVGRDDKVPNTIVMLPGDPGKSQPMGLLYDDSGGNEYEFILGYDDLRVE